MAIPSTKRVVGTGAVVVVLAATVLGAHAASASGSGYELSLVFPSAPNVVKGGKVQVNGFDAGSVTKLAAKNGQAVLTVRLHSPYTKLPQGTTADIEWKAVLGERVVQLHPGPTTNAALPSGAMVRGDDRVELDQLLAAMDPTTRAKLSASLVALDKTVDGRGGDINATLAQLGPTVQALGTVLQGAGADGAAIKDLVSRSASVMQVLQQRSATIQQAIRDLDAQQSVLASHDSEISQSLAELPGTLSAAKTTLDKVPGTVAAAHPVLTGLTAAVQQLPAFTGSLSPLLSDLNPTLAQLRNTTTNLSSLLGITPGLLSSATQLLPQIDTDTGRLVPALSFLRPYTPEITGYFTNWGSAGQQYLGQYHVGRIKGQEGTTTPIGVLTSPPPGVTANTKPLPGSNVGQAWTDASGDRVR